MVLEVGSNGDITVHFKGWSAEHDEVSQNVSSMCQFVSINSSGCDLVGKCRLQFLASDDPSVIAVHSVYYEQYIWT